MICKRSFAQTCAALIIGIGVVFHSVDLLAGQIAAECLSKNTVSGVVAKHGSPILFQLEGRPQRYFADMLIPNVEYPPDNSFDQRTVTLFIPEDAVEDRYQRLPAQIIVHSGMPEPAEGKTFKQGIWWQAVLLSGGESLLTGNHLHSKCFNTLRKIEDAARNSGQGVWDKRFRPLKAMDVDNLAQKEGQFVVVEGKVRTVGDRPTRYYLNFGQNWSQDFTVVVAKKGTNAFKGTWKRLLDIKGKNVRVRGMLEMKGGPLIRLAYEGQLQIAD